MIVSCLTLLTEPKRNNQAIKDGFEMVVYIPEICLVDTFRSRLMFVPVNIRSMS